MSDFAMVAIAAGGTLLMRVSLVALLANATIPPKVEAALKLVVPAVLAGLVAQTLFLEGGDLRPLDAWYPAAAVAVIVAWRTRSTTWTLVVGMIAVWLLAAVGG